MLHPSRTSVFALSLLFLSLSACVTYRPTQTNNICSIFRGETDWYEAARAAQKKWGTPIWVLMAIMHQESHFVDDAQPPRPWFLFIPLPRRSSAYGFAQAQDGVWDEYIEATGNGGADRDDFDDAIDFIGWYTHLSQRRLGISKWEVKAQYLAYHEGRGGYKRGSWKKKAWLLKVAKKVKKRAAIYNTQLKGCRDDLDDLTSSWFF